MLCCESKRYYLWPFPTTVHCARRTKHLRSHREAIFGLWPPQFIVPEGHNIWEVTERLFVALGHHSSLYPKATTFEKSQRGYLWPLATTVHCAWRPQHLRSNREAICGICPPQFIVPEGHSIWEVTEAICGPWPPHFIVPKGHNIWKVTKRIFVVFAHHSSLCPNVTTFEKSQRGYLWSLPTTAHSARRPQHLRSHRESIWGLCPPQFIVAEGHNIWKITERLFLAFAHHSSSLIYATICVICLPQFIVPEGTCSKAFLLSPLPHPTSHHQHLNSWICHSWMMLKTSLDKVFLDAFDWGICCQIVRPIGFLECVHKCRLRPTLDFKADVRRNVHCAPGGNSEISQDRDSYEMKRDNLNNLQWKFHWIRARIGSRFLKTSLNLG